MKKVFVLFLLLILLAGCNKTPTIDAIEPENTNYEEVLVDNGFYSNLIVTRDEIYVIYIKNSDLYAKKFYLDLKPLGSPVKLTNYRDVKEVEAEYLNSYIHLTYLDSSKLYNAVYTLDWGEASVEETSERLQRTTSIDNYSVIEKEGNIYVKKYNAQ